MDKRKELFQKAIPIYNNSGRVLLEFATGVGKTRIALGIANQSKDDNWDVVVSRLDSINDWEKEIRNNGFNGLIQNIYHYNSLSKYHNGNNLILDECHGVTAKRVSSLLDHGIGIGMIGLSATMDDYEKWKLLKIIGFEKQHKVTYTTDQGVDDGILPNYEVWAYLVRMEDKVRREMPPFFKNPITEARAYSWVNKKLGEAMYSDEKNLEKKEKQIKFWTIRRYQIIQSLHSKEKAVKFMINRIPEGKQLIVFCGNIKQANRLCPNAYHSKSEGFELQRFRDGHINQLAVVGMLDEAINLQADIAICLGVNAKTRKLIQRIGRLLRKDPDNPDKLAIMIFFVALGTKEVKWMKTNLKIFRKTKLQLWTRT